MDSLLDQINLQTAADAEDSDFKIRSMLFMNAVKDLPDDLRTYYSSIMDGNLELLSCLESADPDWHFEDYYPADFSLSLNKMLKLMRTFQPMLTEEAGKFRRAGMSAAMKAEADKALNERIYGNQSTGDARLFWLHAFLIILDRVVWDRLDSFIPCNGRRMDAAYFRELLPVADSATVERFVLLRRDTSLLLEYLTLADGSDCDFGMPFNGENVRQFSLQEFQTAYARINQKARTQFAFLLTRILDVAVKKAGSVPALAEAVKQDVFTRRQVVTKFLKCTPDILHLIAKDARSFRRQTADADSIDGLFSQAAKAAVKPFAAPVAATLEMYLGLVSSAYREDIDTLIPHLVEDSELTQENRLALAAGADLSRDFVGVLPTEKILGTTDFTLMHVRSELYDAMDRIPKYDYAQIWTELCVNMTESDSQRFSLYLQTSLAAIEGFGAYAPSLRLIMDDGTDEELSMMSETLGFVKGLAIFAVSKPALYETGMGAFSRFERHRADERTMNHRLAEEVAKAIEQCSRTKGGPYRFFQTAMVTIGFLCSEICLRAEKGEFMPKFNRRLTEGRVCEALNTIIAITKQLTGPNDETDDTSYEAATENVTDQASISELTVQ